MQLESSGLPENFNQVNSIKHAIQKWGHTAPKHTFLDMEEAYDILQLILDQYEFLRKNSAFVSGVVLRSTSSVFLNHNLQSRIAWLVSQMRSAIHR